jgi:hypothetical protein
MHDNIAEGSSVMATRNSFSSSRSQRAPWRKSQLFRALDRAISHKPSSMFRPEMLKASKDIGNFMRYLRTTAT